MTVEELQACRDGYIYIHDMSARRDTMNCCLFDVQEQCSTGGFEMGNLWYNEPKTLDVAFDVIGDIVLSPLPASSTAGSRSRVWTNTARTVRGEVLRRNSTNKLHGAWGCPTRTSRARGGMERTYRVDMEQGFQGWEYKFNSVTSSRGDYPFITMTAGTGTGRFAKMASITMLDVRQQGSGKEELQEAGSVPEDRVPLRREPPRSRKASLRTCSGLAIECSSKAMYPDWLSLTGDGYVASIYKKYGRIISPMGCRAFLSPWYRARRNGACGRERTSRCSSGRFNIGAVCAATCPMILREGSAGEQGLFTRCLTTT